MSPEVAARACEAFFTTRADRGGTGLGLAIVQRLVGEAGGRVRVRSAVGAGNDGHNRASDVYGRYGGRE